MEIYKNKNYSVEERAKNLLSLMTLEEKVAQMYVRQDYEEIEKELDEGKMNFGGVYCIPIISQKKQKRNRKSNFVIFLLKTNILCYTLFFSRDFLSFLATIISVIFLYSLSEIVPCSNK